ncbi:helix-turn-helix domain-containing protein [Frigoribacterium sp. Leaf172]|uniref:helix-turn-helix domain-containing protein n=1 Tax=Frigoribacterium sp. Leaf172 TaxID=1736285 RepID=UPI001F3CAF7D|nr:XRE family transcriptional regulator [Frigoribacterium sp. Leaf172]
MSELDLSMIGPRIRSFREKRCLTLVELSQSTGVSASTLSRLEAGKRAPNLELVVPVARALGLDLDDIVPREVVDPRVEQTVKVIDGVRFETLAAASSPVQTYKVSMPTHPDGAEAIPDLHVHDGYEWIYLLSGRLRLVIAQKEVILNAGESAEFDTRFPHWMTPLEGPAEMLSIFSTEGRRIHMRARPLAEDE